NPTPQVHRRTPLVGFNVSFEDFSLLALWAVDLACRWTWRLTLNKRKVVAGPLLIGACSGRLRKSEGSLLRRPVHRNIKTAGPQCLRGNLRRLRACNNPLPHLGREKREMYKPADVLLADSIGSGDRDHRPASAAHEIVEPAVRSRPRSEH